MEGEKKCPHCAETIKAEATICRYCHLDVSNKRAPAAPNQPECPACHVALIPIQKTNQVSVAGLIGVVAFFFGLLLLFFSPIAGVIVIIVALVVGSVGRGKHTVMTCPQCGKHGATF